MSFNSVLDAQTQIISAAGTRQSLEVQFATYNDLNDPTKATRFGIKTQIKQTQQIIDSGNDYLVANSIAPFRYRKEAFNSDGTVNTLWDNERQIPGTLQYTLAQLPPPSISDLKSLYEQTSNLVAEAGQRLTEKQKRLEQIKASSSTIQELALSQAQADVDMELTNIQQIIHAKEQLNNSIINLSTPSVQPSTDPFSTTIRSQIKNRLSQNPDFDNLQVQVEAALVMRRNALDALYTAKTSQDKQFALDRLQKCAALSDPIIKTFVPYNPNAFSDFMGTLQTTLNDLLVSSQSLSAAQVDLDLATLSNNTVQISAAEVVFNSALDDFKQKERARVLAINTLFGMDASKFSTVMRPGSTNVDTHEELRLSPETQVSPNQETSEVVGSFSQKLKAGDYVYDTKIGEFIPKSNMVKGDPSRYVESKYPTTEDHENQILKNTLDANDTIFKAQTKAINDSIDKENTTWENNSESLNTSIKEYNEKINEIDNNSTLSVEEKTSLKSTLIQQKNQAIAQKEQLDSTHFDNIAQNNKSLVDAQILKNSGDKAANYQYNAAVNASQLTASVDNAQKVTAHFDDAVAQSNQAEREFDIARQGAISRASANLPNGADPTNPNNWAPEDRQRVETTVTNLNTARANELNAAVAFDQYANTTPGGRDSLEASGLSEREISTRLLNGPQSATAIRARNNTPVAKDQIGLVANSIDPSNISSQTGFEGLNSGHPFYLQMPTLNSLRDFNIPNGLNPYASASNDDIARDAIHFNIFEVTPPAPRAVVVPGNAGLVVNQVDPRTTQSIGSFTIYPHNHDYLQMNHSHNYDKGQFFSQIVDAIGNIIDGVNTASMLGGVISNSVTKGFETGIPNPVTSSIKQVDQYSGSEKVSLNIQFKLFTKDDFLNDIFRPLMFLTALSYPKRVLHGNLGTSTSQMAALAKQYKLNKLANLLESGGQLADNAQSTVASEGGFGPFRYYISKKPEYLSVRHASGLFYFPLAAITEVSYSFEGPWYNSGGIDQKLKNDGRFNSFVGANIDTVLAQTAMNNPDATIGQRFAAIGQTFKDNSIAMGKAFKDFGKQVSDTIQGREVNLGGVDDTFKSITPNKYAYPAIANCSITVANLVPSFRDDYIQLMDAAANGGQSLVNVTVNQTGSSPAFVKDRPITDEFTKGKR